MRDSPAVAPCRSGRVRGGCSARREGLYRAGLLLVVLVFALEIFQRLDASDVCVGNEAVEGLVVERLVERGEPVVPAALGSPVVYKPPLFHWTAAALHRLAGVTVVTATTLRATSAVYALGGLVLTILVSVRVLGVRAALLAALTLAASYQYVAEARFGRVDMALTFYEWAALVAFLGWLRTRAKFAIWLVALATGLAMLAKGPVGALLPGATMVLFLVLEGRSRDLRAVARPGPVLLAVAIGAGFYAACWLAGRTDVLQRQVASENFGRFFGSLGRMKTSYYLDPLLLNSVPMSLLAPLAVLAALRTRWREAAEPDRRHALPGMRLLALFWLVTVVFFQLAAYKRRNYLLPIWPAAAVLLAWWIDRLARRSVVVPWRRIYVAACAVMIAFNVVYLPIKERRECVHGFGRPVAEVIASHVARDAPLYSLGLDDEKDAPVLFYLHRDVEPLHADLALAPPGYLIVRDQLWRAARASAPGFEEVLEAGPAARRFVLLRRANGEQAAQASRADG